MSPSCAVVFIGIQGSGKSATANSFLGGEKYFKSRSGTIQNTTECASKEIPTSQECKKAVFVVDTPPLNTLDDFENIKRYVAGRQFSYVQYVTVIKTGRFSIHEISLLQRLHKRYSSDLEKTSIVIFSNAAELGVCENNQESMTLEMYVKESEMLRRFLASFVLRYFGIDNVNWDSNEKAKSVQSVLQFCEFRMDSTKPRVNTGDRSTAATPQDGRLNTARQHDNRLATATPHGDSLTKATPHGDHLTTATPHSDCLTNTTPHGDCLTKATPHGDRLTKATTHGDRLTAGAPRDDKTEQLASQVDTESTSDADFPDDFVFVSI